MLPTLVTGLRERPARRYAARVIVPAVVAGLALAAAGCSGTGGSSGPVPGQAAPGPAKASKAKAAAVMIDLTPAGCRPRPASVPAGMVDFTVVNKGARAVSEAELRTADLSGLLGEQENLTPGLSGGFSVADLQPGNYKFYCPGARKQHWRFTVTGKPSASATAAGPRLTAAVRSYAGYVGRNAAALVSHTQAFCRAIDAGRMSRAKKLYPRARIYYERIEPVAEIWGTLDTEIDGRWENPVTVPARFTGFHKIEQLIWADDTLAGTPALCAGLVRNEQELRRLVRITQYNPLEMASGATELINEAATSKITGEEERYSNTDLPVFQANVDGALEVVSLLRPYLRHKDPSLLTQIHQRAAAVASLLARYKASPGYDDTGYADYTTVLTAQRRELATTVGALAEALSGLSAQISS